MDDLDQLIEVFDKALTSKDERIKTALKKFMFVVLMTEGEETSDIGPFTDMKQRLDSMEKNLADLRSYVQSLAHSKSGTYTYPNVWTDSTYYPYLPNKGGSWAGGGTTTTISTQSTSGVPSAGSINLDEYKEYITYLNNILQDEVKPISKTDV